jgi:CheY-like chemotaxis protein
MPHMDGLEATRRILAAPGARTRVLMLTTFDLDEYVYDATRAGASGFPARGRPRRPARRGDPHRRRRRRAARPHRHTPADRGVRPRRAAGRAVIYAYESGLVRPQAPSA